MSLANSTFTPNRTALLDSTPALIPGLRSYVAQTYSAGSSFSLGNITTFSDLSEFCRFGAQYNTSTNSQIQLRFGCRRPIIGMDGLLMLGMVGILALSHTRTSGFNIHVGQLNMNKTTLGEVVPTSFFSTWAQEVLAQCDEIDGVKDNIILNPRLCAPDPSTVVCGAANASVHVNSSTCITEGQATTLAAVYNNWTSSATGELLFPSYDPGSENGWTALLSGTPFGLSSDFFLYQVYNYTTLQPVLVIKNETELERITTIGDETDPGQGNAVSPNLTPFFQRGGKLMVYHGSADMNIPSGSSTHYYEQVRAYYNESTDLRNYYRLFLVPGMGHCEGGNGADGFGCPQQQTNGRGDSLVYDGEHDAVLALMRWVENGTAPNQIISAKYVDNNKTKSSLQDYCALTRKRASMSAGM